MLSSFCVCSVSERGLNLFLFVTVDELLAPPRHDSSSEKGVGGEFLGMLVCSGNCYGSPQALGATAGVGGRGVKQQKCICSQLWRLGSLRSSCQPVWFLVRASSRIADGHLIVFSHGEESKFWCLFLLEGTPSLLD